MKIDSFLASARKHKGLSQNALAEICGLSLRAIQRIEAGETTPRPHTIKVIANALDIPVKDLTERFTGSSDIPFDKSLLPQLSIINFSALSGLIVPLANVLIPMFLAKSHDKLKREVSYKKIISFQVIWSLITLLVVVFTPLTILLFTQTVAFGRTPPPALLAYGVMVLLNVSFTIKSAFQLRSDAEIYNWVPRVF